MKYLKIAIPLLALIASCFIAQSLLAADQVIERWTFGPWQTQSMISWGSDRLIVDSGINGLWSYDDGDGSWIRLSLLDPISMVVLGESNLVVNFGPHGLWKFDKSTWEKIAL